MTTEMGDRQFGLFVTRSAPPPVEVAPLKTQLLKWIGNKQRFAHEIVGQFPARFGTYFEPSRFAGVDGRLHRTAGVDLHLGKLAWEWRLTAAFDVAKNYTNAGLSLGFWH